MNDQTPPQHTISDNKDVKEPKTETLTPAPTLKQEVVHHEPSTMMQVDSPQGGSLLKSADSAIENTDVKKESVDLADSSMTDSSAMIKSAQEIENKLTGVEMVRPSLCQLHPQSFVHFDHLSLAESCLIQQQQ